MSCAKTAQPIEMQLWMLSQVGPGNILHGDVDASSGMGTFEVSGQLKSIVKRRIWG